jgi:hypothetical protein
VVLKVTYKFEGNTYTKELNVMSYIEMLIKNIEVDYYSDLGELKEHLKIDLSVLKYESESE